MKVKIQQWHAVASWTWDAQDETCGICRMAFDGCCPDCKLPGDDCPLSKLSSMRCVNIEEHNSVEGNAVWGQCNHAFHLHCILKWVNTQTCFSSKFSLYQFFRKVGIQKLVKLLPSLLIYQFGKATPQAVSLEIKTKKEYSDILFDWKFASQRLRLVNIASIGSLVYYIWQARNKCRIEEAIALPHVVLQQIKDSVLPKVLSKAEQIPSGIECA
ncbi:hypothetical protein KSS87_020093 [Heliosperma pusillum]|nr:hypothetical protein KSS87_020093 [Heliosperma pusillum]